MDIDFDNIRALIYEHGCGKQTPINVLDALSQIDGLKLLLSPNGTLLERQSRLVEVAKMMGFGDVVKMFWCIDGWPYFDTANLPDEIEMIGLIIDMPAKKPT